MLTSSEIRSKFLDFFQSKGHTIVPSAPIVVKNDPTLLFTNAGMNQFKDYFLGNSEPPYKRAADTQKCLRVSGKHNDLEEVGVDTYHHTMFEMLGNWSFGDYFKAEAIAWSWELLTEVYQIDKSRLYVTVFEGDDSDGLPFDQEAYDEWKKWIPEAHILKGNKHDNFWEMGDTGPCGPCSEIHVDCRPESERSHIPGAGLVNGDHPQVIEIWNNVFMQFNRLSDGHLSPLPARHVDTGMGFERLVRILQDKSSNYDTDVFSHTIDKIAAITGKKYNGSNTPDAIAFRVNADHIRAIAFAISDGQLPSNTGAGYVIRRILRRAVRYYYSYLDYKSPLLHQLVAVIAGQFETVFPELQQQQAFVSKVIKEEEEAFLRTLERGLNRIGELMHTARNGVIDGKAAFELYDTYGFPEDLTALIASEHHLSVDHQAFKQEMALQKNRSRAATAINAGDWIITGPDAKTEFVGYHDLNVQTNVLKYRELQTKGKKVYQIVLEKTPFYAEMGGQVGDTGVLIFGNEEIPVTDTKKENELIVHFVSELPQNKEALAAQDHKVVAKVDWERRFKIMYNHTATHLLHAALRQKLGTHVEQKGSLVSAEALRFDFSHFARMTQEEIKEVENLVNEKIRENIRVVIREYPKEEAMQLGAMHLFGEKYGAIVRVVTIDPAFSVEFCGGTHVNHTGQIGLFKIQAESAVAAGIRRIEAVTGPEAIDYICKEVMQNKTIADLLKSKDPVKSVEKLLEEKSALEKKLQSLETRQYALTAKDLAAHAEQVNEVTFIGSRTDVDSIDALKKISFEIRRELESNSSTPYMVVLTATGDGKALVSVMLDDQLKEAKALDAGKLIKETVAPLIKGGGGGQPTLATAGGKETGNLDKVIDQLKAMLN